MFILYTHGTKVVPGQCTQHTTHMAGKGIIEINYEMPFEGMLINAEIPRYQREKIFKQLGSKDLKFPHKGKVAFAIRNFRFKDCTLSRTAAKCILTDNSSEIPWKPFDIEHVLAYFEKNPSKFDHSFIFASRRTFDVEDSPHVFVLTKDKGRADLELVPDNHAWAPQTSIFPGQSKL